MEARIVDHVEEIDSFLILLSRKEFLKLAFDWDFLQI